MAGNDDDAHQMAAVKAAYHPRGKAIEAESDC
jgi:hypothetical protein